MNDELRERIVGEICSMIEKNPGLLKMIELLDKLYRDVERIKQEIVQVKCNSEANHAAKFQDFVETMLFGMSEMESKLALEQKLKELTEMVRQKDEQLKEAEAAHRQIAAARKEASDEAIREIESKNVLLSEIKGLLAGFCDLPRTKRWQLILNEDNIFSRFKGVEEKIDAALSGR